jgi:hypothetical protein
MTAIKTERPGDGDNAGPDIYSPQNSDRSDQRPPEKLGQIDAAASAFEGEIREFVRRDAGFWRRQQRSNETEPTQAESAAGNLNTLIHRVAGASTEEIERVIVELQGVRDMLRNEGERISQEVARYASLNHTAITAMKVIGDSLAQWKNAPNKSRPSTAG